MTFIILGRTEESGSLYCERLVYFFYLLDNILLLEVFNQFALILSKRLSPEDKCEDAATANPALLARLCQHPPLTRTWDQILVSQIPLENELINVFKTFFSHLAVNYFVLVHLADEHALLQLGFFNLLQVQLFIFRHGS